MKSKHFLFIALASCLVAFSSFKAANTDFSGTWTLNEAKSDMGGSQFNMVDPLDYQIVPDPARQIVQDPAGAVQ